MIYYSLVRPAKPEYDFQWVQSIRSLRLWNPEIAVCLFIFNGVSDAVQEEAERWGVRIISLGDYRAWLRGLHPRGDVLALYPTLHKFLVLGQMDTRALSQALYVDCDTFFFDDPEQLFETGEPRHWCAREELGSRLCAGGYDPSNIDEEIIAGVLAAQGLNWVHPFNSGVCLLGGRIWETVWQLRVTFLDTVWRLLVGRECWTGRAAGDEPISAAVLAEARAHDVARALPYPSDNAWIIEEIALWLTFAHIENFTQAMFPLDRVAQGLEFTDAIEAERLPVVAHYFSCFQDSFFEHITPLRG